ncbi:MAG: nuclear transport factor 2 family protein [Betaproteobacteria bacterium]|nr:nuclear transport factor 2 family protein [Betaproteobacteria bacterium]
MTSLKLALPVVAILFSPLAASAAGPLETVEQFHAALAGGNSQQALDALAENVLIYESGHKETSRAEYAGSHLAADMTFSQGVKRIVSSSRQILMDGHALVMQETETSGAYKGKPVHLIGLETTLLVKRDNAWRIEHIHWSSRSRKAP